MALIGCNTSTVSEGYKVTVTLIVRNEVNGQEKAIPWSDIKVFFSGRQVKSGTAGSPDEHARVTIGPLQGEVQASFLLDGYETTVHLLTLREAGHFEVSRVDRMIRPGPS